LSQPAAKTKNRPKKYEKRDEVERLILDAAETAFAEGGFGGTSMQQIADLVQLPKANLHYYFATKVALYCRVVERIFLIWLEAAATFDAHADPARALASYIDAKMEISRHHPAGSKVWAAEVMHGAPVVHDYLETTLREWTADRALVIRRWIDEGLILPVDPQHLLYMIWATTQHYADFRHQIETLNQDQPLSDEAWAAAKKDVVDIILRGVGLEAPGPRF
jgi:TetR/AcrR family transcriptional regulator